MSMLTRVLAALALLLPLTAVAPCATSGAELRFRHVAHPGVLRARGARATCRKRNPAPPRRFRGAGPQNMPTMPDRLYAVRALRRMRLIIEMRLLQLREERLECVRQAILRNLPPDIRPSGRRGEGARRPDPETCEQLFP